MNAGAARSSAAIVQRVPPEAAEAFRQWQREITAVAETFAGFEGTDVYPPTVGQADEWVTVIHFASEESLARWLDSPQRAQRVQELRATVGDFELKTLHGGFSAWFTGVNHAAAEPLPGWKMALTVLLGLYPTVLLLTVFVGPFTSQLGFSIAMLIGNALSVALLQWVVVPLLTRWLQPWLSANSPAARGWSLAGVGAILLALLALALLFRPITG